MLILEDNPADAELMTRALQKAGVAFEARRATNEREFRGNLTPNVGVILADYSLPGFGAIEALAITRALGIDCPFIVVSGSIGDERAIECLRIGATDYVLKDHLARLPEAIVRSLEQHRLRRERTQIVEALRRSEEEMRRILSTIADVVWSYSLESGSLLFLSPAAERVLGLRVADLVASPSLWRECVHVEDRARVAEGLMSATRWGTAEVEHRVVRPDGSIRNVLSRSWAATDEAGKPIRLHGIMTDLTDRKRAEAERAELARVREVATRLQVLNDFRKEFISVMAHEIANPLTPIQLQLELLAPHVEPLGDPPLRAFRSLRRNVNRLGDLLQDLLDASRLQAGHLRLRIERFDLAATVHGTVEGFEGQARSVGIDLSAEAPHSLAIEGDSRRIEQLLINLVGNALKFTPAGGSVQVRLATAGDGVHLSVADTGRGVSAEEMSDLFQPFLAGKGSGQGRHTGTGLGLFISKGIAEAHGGRIECESAGIAKGATFHVHLPLRDGSH